MSDKKKLLTRRDFLSGFSAALISAGGIALGLNGCQEKPASRPVSQKTLQKDPSSWWNKDGFIVHDNVDAGGIDKKIIQARVNGTWQSFKVIELPDRFMEWSLMARVSRLERMVRAGGMDFRDLAGSHNACVATCGGPSRDSAVSINTAYKGMGFAVKADKIAQKTEEIKEERYRIARDTGHSFSRMLQAQANFLISFYSDISSFDRTKQVSLELFTSADFQTHTFLNMMANPIASASFLAFPTFEIRTVPQLLHPKNPNLSKYEKDLIAYTNAIHDFIHSGLGDRITCVYHIIELFDDTPNDQAKGKRIV